MYTFNRWKWVFSLNVVFYLRFAWFLTVRELHLNKSDNTENNQVDRDTLQKSPCYQLEPPRRQRQRDIPAGQGRNFSQTPSIPKAPSVTSIESMQTITSSVGGSVMSITSSLSSDSSSSGTRMLISEPSRSYSRNTMNGLQSPWTSTSSLKVVTEMKKRYHFFKFY